MADFVLIDGDEVIFLPVFTPAVVVVQPGKLKGSGPALFDGKKICVDGDEGDVEVPGCQYLTPVYSVPGSGTLKIKELDKSQVAEKTLTGGKAMLLKGAMFTAEFQVQSPAMMPPTASSPDSTTSYSGKGMFFPQNTKFKAT